MTTDTLPKFDLDTVPAIDRDRVEALIPDPRIADAYVHRSVKGWLDFDILDGCVEDLENVLLAGPTGSSKTTLFRAYAAARGLPFTVVECNASMDPGTVLGRISIAPDGSVSYVYGDWSLVVKYGGVGLVDEINMAHPRITAAFHQLFAVTRRMSIPEAGETLVAGRGGMGERQPTLYGCAFNNRYQGVVRLNEALKNRFPVKLPWGYDRGVEAQLVTSRRLLDLADNTRALSEIRSPLSTNMLMEFERHAHKWGMPLAMELFVNAFEADEQAPVARALEANATGIAKELGIHEVAS